MQQSLIVGLSSIIADQAAQIEALEKRAACAEEELPKAKRTKKGNEVSHCQPQSSQTAVLCEAERLSRHLLVEIRGWRSLESFKTLRLVRKTSFRVDSVRLGFSLLAENGIVDIQIHPKRARNRALTTVVKRPWSRIESDTKGVSFLTRLQVNRDAFD